MQEQSGVARAVASGAFDTVCFFTLRTHGADPRLQLAACRALRAMLEGDDNVARRARHIRLAKLLCQTVTRHARDAALCEAALEIVVLLMTKDEGEAAKAWDVGLADAVVLALTAHPGDEGLLRVRTGRVGRLERPRRAVSEQRRPSPTERGGSYPPSGNKYTYKKEESPAHHPPAAAPAAAARQACHLRHLRAVFGDSEEARLLPPAGVLSPPWSGAGPYASRSGRRDHVEQRVNAYRLLLRSSE